MTQMTETRSITRRALALVLLYAAATLVGGVIFVALLRAALALLGPGVMFYRGVGALIVDFLLLIALVAAAAARLPRCFGIDGADALGAAIVATSLLLAAFVLGPITADRSISVFMLSQFDAAARPMTATQARDAFVRVYVDDWAQIDRRLKEQALSGNLEQGPDGWRLTAQGRAFMKTARALSSIFGGDPRFVGRKD
ncbi:hypothetical protein OGR47_00315 [Methylocystis sp. MJC1]|jgi:hypothetical protein|uniref:hypothetical protein n=1 Tax=Methylocystis sp. MJC1 TaxID=2654282 RepID=UPI0019CFD5E6|nr:hypothetical protein [Methylocystis sp. MJC1]KAF2991971.1 hypothetical protein MJC1_00994 [Methylocystis sp. MJC1]MBU6525460.1 hypothetical protein [Methylocystis sp. MJC1]UZX11949.1 hypothetical protein OGR47_00315 [Methylocystis sp. MJC1]